MVGNTVNRKIKSSLILILPYSEISQVTIFYFYTIQLEKEKLCQYFLKKPK